MQLDQALKRVAVLGAAGKMGSGIATLLLLEMARLELEQLGQVGTGAYLLYLIDAKESSLPQLRSYLRDQLYKYAEKNINYLRKCYAQNPQLVSNEEIIEAFAVRALDLISFDTSADVAKNAHLIFEAIIEDPDIKAKVLRGIVELGNKEGFFFSNTSSIPIHVLNEKGNINNRIIGFHFYNPPIIQKLVEIIIPENANPTLVKMASELAKRLNKIVVYSKDVAGFIGNGHLIREIAFACHKVEQLAKDCSLEEAIYKINRVTQDWLIRPMGIFQLVDYVGLDVGQLICNIMSSYLKDTSLHLKLIDDMLKQGIRGGQNPDGSQKNGFFSYDKHAITGIYSLSHKKYIPWGECSWKNKADQALGELPRGHLPWKTMMKESDKEKKLRTYFEELCNQNTPGSHLAQAFLQNSFSIAQELVQEGIANSQNDVDTVLTQGFYHLYGTKECPQGARS